MNFKKIRHRSWTNSTSSSDVVDPIKIFSSTPCKCLPMLRLSEDGNSSRFSTLNKINISQKNSKTSQEYAMRWKSKNSHSRSPHNCRPYRSANVRGANRVVINVALVTRGTFNRILSFPNTFFLFVYVLSYSHSSLRINSQLTQTVAAARWLGCVSFDVFWPIFHFT